MAGARHHLAVPSFPWDVLGQLYEFGFVRGVVPVALGGDELTAMMQAILMEEAGRCWGSLRTTLNVQGMVARVLAAAGTREQRGDTYVINGSKLYITNALDCDFGVLLARVVDDDGSGGVSAFLIEKADSEYGGPRTFWARSVLVSAWPCAR